MELELIIKQRQALKDEQDEIKAEIKAKLDGIVGYELREVAQ